VILALILSLSLPQIVVAADHPESISLAPHTPAGFSAEVPRSLNERDAVLTFTYDSEDAAHLPQNLTLDVGSDGAAEWMFPGTLGMQTSFESGVRPVVSPGAGMSFYLPQNSTVAHGEIAVEGVPENGTTVRTVRALVLEPHSSRNLTAGHLPEGASPSEAYVEAVNLSAASHTALVQQGLHNQDADADGLLQSVYIPSDAWLHGLALPMDVYSAGTLTVRVYRGTPWGLPYGEVLTAVSRWIPETAHRIEADLTFPDAVHVSRGEVIVLTVNFTGMARCLFYSSGSNGMSPLNTPSTWLSRTSSGPEYGSDLSFTLHALECRGAGDAASLRVDGRSLESSLMLPEPLVLDGTWHLQIANTGGELMVVTLKCILGYSLFPENISLTLDGTDLALDSGTAHFNVSSERCDKTDLYGNSYTAHTVRVHFVHGKVAVSLEVHYSLVLTLTVHGITSYYPGTDFTFLSDTECTLRIISLDMPGSDLPVYRGAVFTVDEEGSTSLNLSSVFYNSDRYSVISWAPPEMAVELSGRTLVADLTGYDNYTGPAHVLVRACSSGGCTLQRIVFDVVDSPDAPVLLDVQRTAYSGSTYTAPVAAVDGDGDSPSLRLLSGPDGMRLEGEHLVWLPEPGDVGWHTVALMATDGQLSVYRSFTLVCWDASYTTTVVRTRVGEHLFLPRPQVAGAERVEFSEMPEGAVASEDGIHWRPDTSGKYIIAYRASRMGEALEGRYIVTVSERDSPCLSIIHWHLDGSALYAEGSVHPEGADVSLLVDGVRYSTTPAYGAFTAYVELRPGKHTVVAVSGDVRSQEITVEVPEPHEEHPLMALAGTVSVLPVLGIAGTAAAARPRRSCAFLIHSRRRLMSYSSKLDVDHDELLGLAKACLRMDPVPRRIKLQGLTMLVEGRGALHLVVFVRGGARTARVRMRAVLRALDSEELERWRGGYWEVEHLHQVLDAFSGGR